MVDGGRCYGIAGLRKALIAIHQVGQTAVTQFGKVGHQSRNHVSTRQPAAQSHLPHLVMGAAAGKEQFRVDLLVDLWSRIVVNIVELGGFGFVGQI